jgi:DNA-binding phage protein
MHVTLSETKEAPISTAYERYRAQRLADSQFRALYDRKRAHIDAIDWILSEVDERRVAMGLTKADLARLVGRKPESVRRLFSARTANPTLSTVLDMAFVLGLEIGVAPTASVDELAPRVQAAAHELAGRAR